MPDLIAYIIELTFCRLKDFRAIATRNDKPPKISSPACAFMTRRATGSIEPTPQMERVYLLKLDR
jgi:hypothetical protein